MKSNRLPQLTLALLLAVAACVVLGGAWLARRAETVRVPRDRAPLREFAATIEEQAQQLEELYASHLRAIADRVDLRNAAGSREACERIIGIRQLSVLHATGDSAADQHVLAMKPPPGEKWPEPALRDQPQSGLPRPVRRLPESAILTARAERAGWIDRPGQPLVFWQRREFENVALVFVIDRAQVATAIDEWFRAWLASEAGVAFAGVVAAGGPDRLLGTNGASLVAAGPAPAQPERPDFLLPLRARLGTWQLASWDRHETRTSYHTPTLAAAAALGVFTALLGLAVAAQQRRAAALAAQRVSFVNRVSHELRTPLTNILLNLDLAAETLAATGEPPRRLALVREEAGRLGRLIDNVLTFSRHEQGKLRADPHACIPASVIAAVVEQFAPSFHRRALTVRRTGDATTPCLLDADALAQILANLLSNVEKYVPGGAVEIASTLADGALAITVADEGPGIAARDAERIFRPFERLNSRVNEGASGTGLGLAIARDLAASMGGTLRLLPSARGAAFELRVPAPRATGPEILPDTGPSAKTA